MSVFTLSGDQTIIVESDAEMIREADGFHIRSKRAPKPPGPTPTPVNILGTVAVVNQSTTDSDATVQKWIDAVKIQSDRDISRFWGGSVDFLFVGKKATPPPADWYCLITDNSDTAGALGWHDVGPNGEPLIKIFTEFEAQGAGSSSITLSHEIAESISDTNANTTIQGFDEQGKACLYFLENADPVENNTYQINGVDVSDFVTKQWFVKGSTAQLDYLRAVSKPYQILPQGYMELSYDQGQTWTSVNKNSKRASLHRGPDSRYALYKKKIDQRIKSTFKIA